MNPASPAPHPHAGLLKSEKATGRRRDERVSLTVPWLLETPFLQTGQVPSGERQAVNDSYDLTNRSGAVTVRPAAPNASRALS